MTVRGMSLSKIVDSLDSLKQVKKNGVQSGDTVIVITLNSTYTIRVLGNSSYMVSGGWFDKRDVSPQRITITGCTWGGTSVKRDIIAAEGLRLEFGNKVVTSPIRKMIVVPYSGNN